MQTHYATARRGLLGCAVCLGCASVPARCDVVAGSLRRPFLWSWAYAPISSWVRVFWVESYNIWVCLDFSQAIIRCEVVNESKKLLKSIYLIRVDSSQWNHAVILTLKWKGEKRCDLKVGAVEVRRRITPICLLKRTITFLPPLKEYFCIDWVQWACSISVT